MGLTVGSWPPAWLEVSLNISSSELLSAVSIVDCLREIDGIC